MKCTIKFENTYTSNDLFSVLKRLFEKFVRENFAKLRDKAPEVCDICTHLKS